MKKYPIKSPAHQSNFLRKRIAKNRSRAAFVGVVYLFALFALAAAVCFPMLSAEAAAGGVTEFWKAFLPKNIKAINFRDGGDVLQFVNVVLYALTLLILLISVLRALGKLNWLFKRKASKTYGFNRNRYAMESLGKTFGGCFAWVINVNLFAYALCPDAKIRLLLLIVLGGGVLVALFCNVLGAKVSYFDIEAGGKIVEQARPVGRGGPFVRNLIQLCVAFGGAYVFLRANTLDSYLSPLLAKGAMKGYFLNDLVSYIPMVLQFFSLLFIMILIKHATGIAEYSHDGADGAGMKTFRVVTFLLFLTAAGTAVLRYVLGEACFAQYAGGFVKMINKGADYNSTILAGVALVSFIIEVAMRKLPRERFDTNKTAVYSVGEEKPAEVDVESLLFTAGDEVEDADIKSMLFSMPETIESMGEKELSCPYCGQRLRVDGTSRKYRCPSCEQIINL